MAPTGYSGMEVMYHPLPAAHQWRYTSQSRCVDMKTLNSQILERWSVTYQGHQYHRVGGFCRKPTYHAPRLVCCEWWTRKFLCVWSSWSVHCLRNTKFQSSGGANFICWRINTRIKKNLKSRKYYWCPRSILALSDGPCPVSGQTMYRLRLRHII